MQEVRQIRLEEVRLQHPTIPAVCICEDGKMVWLQRILFWLMVKLGCRHPYTKESISYREVCVTRDHSKRLVDMILAEMYEGHPALRNGWRAGMLEIAVGEDVWLQVLRETAPNMPYTAQWPALPVRAPGEAPTMLGLRVTVIPWMSGWVLLPIDRNGVAQC
jgi:hypothetical protein